MYIRTKNGVYKVSHYNDWATHKRKGATLSFRKEEVLLLAGEEMNKCKKMIEKINEELGKIELNEDE